MTVLISASFASGQENDHFLQGDELPHPLPIPTVGHHPGTLHHVKVLNKVDKVNEEKNSVII